MSDSQPTGWQPIETAPRDGSRILVGWKGHDRVVVTYWTDDHPLLGPPLGFEGEIDCGWLDLEATGDIMSNAPTDWMLLPRGPKFDTQRTAESSAERRIAEDERSSTELIKALARTLCRQDARRNNGKIGNRAALEHHVAQSWELFRGDAEGVVRTIIANGFQILAAGCAEDGAVYRSARVASQV